MSEFSSPIVVVLESPFSGDIPVHVAYAQRAMTHARSKGEVVIAPHLMWTQHHKCPDHFVSDYDPKYQVENGGRDAALKQIHELRRRVNVVVFYIDYGYSSGMKDGLEQCKRDGIPMEERCIGNLEEDVENAKSRSK